MQVTTPLWFLNSRQQKWHDEQKQFQASGLTVREFCRLHRLTQSTFYKRRERLAQLRSTSLSVESPEHTPAFIDAGLIKKFTGQMTPAIPTHAVNQTQAAGLELRLDLGAGMTLTLTRR